MTGLGEKMDEQVVVVDDGSGVDTPPPSRLHARKAGSALSRGRLGAAHWLIYPAAVFVASRLVVMFAVWLSLRVHPDAAHYGILKRWDGGWYILVAQKGYSHAVAALAGGSGDAAQSAHAFFPFFPLLLRLGHGAGFSYLLTSLAVNTVAGIAAVALLWRLVSSLSGADAADRAVTIFCLFPGSYVFTMVYADGVLIALAIACIMALRSRRWV